MSLHVSDKISSIVVTKFSFLRLARYEHTDENVTFEMLRYLFWHFYKNMIISILFEFLIIQNIFL